MEMLKSLSLNEDGKNIELSVHLSGGVASVTLGHGMSDSQVIQQLHSLANLIEEGARERASARHQLSLSGV